LLEPYTARGKVTQKLFDAGSSFFIRTIGRFTGIEVLQELAELLSGFTAMFEGFRQRARAVRMLLGDEGTTFVIVSAPRPDQIADARGFYDRLVADEIQVGAIVLNRARIDPFGGEEIPSPDVFAELLTEAGGSSDLLRRLMETAAQARAIAQHEASAARELAAAAGAVPVVTIPELPRDVHDLLSLRDLGAHLFRRDAIVPPSV
jgi:anion-transporting  ArsA/GET3 family ATPase